MDQINNNIEFNNLQAYRIGGIGPHIESGQQYVFDDYFRLG